MKKNLIIILSSLILFSVVSLLLVFVFKVPIASSQDSNERVIQESQGITMPDVGDEEEGDQDEDGYNQPDFDPNTGESEDEDGMPGEEDSNSLSEAGDDSADGEEEVGDGSGEGDRGEDVQYPNIVTEKDGSNIRLIGYIAFFITLFLLFIVTTLLFRHVKWRRRYTKNDSIVFPDAHLDVLDDLRIHMHGLTTQILDFSKVSLGNQKNNESLIAQMIESMTKLNSTIDSQNKEIERLKQGYDFSIKKNSILPLIELNNLVKDFLFKNTISEETRKKLDSVNKYIESYLEEMDVFEFEIDSGKSTRELSSDIFEIAGLEITNNDELNEKVVKTIKKGYENIHPNGKNVLMKAKIIVYKKGEKNE